MSESTPFTPPVAAPNPFANVKVCEMAPVAPTQVAVEEISSEVTKAREENPKAHILEISNFQSIKEQVFILQGFVTIQGNSDLGKSAIVRALRALINNDWQPDWLRDGEKLCTISLYFSLEMVAQHGVSAVHLYKSKTRNEYIVEFDNKPAKSYPKIGRDVPQELKQLGFSPIATDRGDSFNLNVQKQHKSLFLVTNTGVELTSFFNALFQIDKYEKANRTVNADTLDLQRSINFKTDLTQQKDIAFKNLKVELPAIEQEAQSAEEAERAFSTLLTQAKTISSATQKLAGLEDQSLQQRAKAESTQQAFNYVQSLDQILARLSSIRNGIRMLSAMETELSTMKAQGASKNSAKAFMEGFETRIGSLVSVREVRESLETSTARHATLLGKIEVAKPATALLETSLSALDKILPLRNAIQALSSLDSQLDQNKKAAEKASQAAAPIEGAIKKVDLSIEAHKTLDPLRNAIGIISKLEQEALAPRQKAASLSEALEYVTSTLADFSQYLPVCKTCGQALPQHSH